MVDGKKDGKNDRATKLKFPLQKAKKDVKLKA